jgi:hypothetical protein
MLQSCLLKLIPRNGVVLVCNAIVLVCNAIVLVYHIVVLVLGSGLYAKISSLSL